MWRWITAAGSPTAEGQAPASARRDRLAMLLALLTAIGLASGLLFSKGRQVLMPGPLTSAHGAIENCNACHTSSGSGKLSWLHGLIAGDPRADSKACLTCHKMPDTAFNAHGASTEVLTESTERLMKIAVRLPGPRSARVQDAAFPTHDVVARGLSCATCHQEHQGVAFSLNKISNEQCRSCHVVKFDSFNGRHPKFDGYPFKRRTRIIYDHAGHFGKHYPEVAKKDPAKRIPETCSSCHNSRDDKRVMSVVPFERTCAGCHLDQIVGKERASGPKGIAFLTVPGLDLQTLKQKNAAIGEWPDGSEAALTPFMKVMIGRNKSGRALLKTVDRLNLQDLTNANDEQIKAVTALAWEVKALFHALIKGKASDVLGDLNIGGGGKLSPAVVADLTANIPRDVVMSAQQEWLPSLATEMANRPPPTGQKQSTQTPAVKAPAGSPSSKEPGGDAAAAKTDTANIKPDGEKPRRSLDSLPPPMRAGVGDAVTLVQSTAPANTEDELSVDEHGGTTIKGRQLLQSGTPREARNKKAKTGAAGSDEKGDKANAKQAPDKDAAKSTPSEAASGKTDAANAPAPDAKTATDQQPQGTATEQTDDLLFPTEAELREMKSGSTGKAVQPEATAKSDATGSKPDAAASTNAVEQTAASPTNSSTSSGSTAPTPRANAAPVISIGSDVDPETWAEYGGWYRQDYAIFYRPTGHKDKLIYAWLFLTGPQAPKDDKSTAAAVFDFLTSKDAQGSCTKCHSVDDIQGKGRLVNFSPPSVASKQGRFTSFVHEPHFGIMENRGCLTCHGLEKDRPYLKSYEQGNPQNFASNFGDVKKDLCQGCHTATKARQDCLLCHKYHVNGVVTPIISTRLPIQ